MEFKAYKDNLDKNFGIYGIYGKFPLEEFLNIINKFSRQELSNIRNIGKFFSTRIFEYKEYREIFLENNFAI